MLKTLISIVFFLPVMVAAYAQDLTGTWVGGAGSTAVTIVLVKCGDHYVGHTHDEDGMGFCKTNFEAKFDTATKKFKGKSMGFIDHSLLHSQTNYNLTYSASGNRELLKGSVSPKSVANKILSFGIPISGVTLTRQSYKTDTTEFMHAALMERADTATSVMLASPQKSTATAPEVNSEIAAYNDSLALLSARRERSNLVMETITISSATIQIKVYDNGVEDGDSISILYNNRVLRSNIAVTVKPVSFELTLDDNLADHDITLIALNLGSIPPNTANVEIKAGEKMYRISASASMTKNAVIRLKYEKPAR